MEGGALTERFVLLDESEVPVIPPLLLLLVLSLETGALLVALDRESLVSFSCC